MADNTLRYKMAGQCFALPKLFKESKNEGYQVVRSDDEVIQFKNEQVRPTVIFCPCFLILLLVDLKAFYDMQTNL
jgi:hypothetical protein